MEPLGSIPLTGLYSVVTVRILGLATDYKCYPNSCYSICTLKMSIFFIHITPILHAMLTPLRLFLLNHSAPNNLLNHSTPYVLLNHTSPCVLLNRTMSTISHHYDTHTYASLINFNSSTRTFSRKSASKYKQRLGKSTRASSAHSQKTRGRRSSERTCLCYYMM